MGQLHMELSATLGGLTFLAGAHHASWNSVWSQLALPMDGTSVTPVSQAQIPGFPWGTHSNAGSLPVTPLSKCSSPRPGTCPYLPSSTWPEPRASRRDLAGSCLLLTLCPPFLWDLAQSGRRRDAPVYAPLRSLLGLSICAGVNGVPLRFTSIWNLCVCVCVSLFGNRILAEVKFT